MTPSLKAQLIDALESVEGNINPERGFCDEVEAEIKEALAALRAEPVAVPMLVCDIEPRPLLNPLSDYHKAMSEGPLNYTWRDKPHRLVYDLIAAVKYYASPPQSAVPDKWTVTAPDGTKFVGDTPLRAASQASKYRLEIDPIAAAKFLAVIEEQRAAGEAERTECMEKYGTLDCPHCGGSGHIADAMANAPTQSAPLTDEQIGMCFRKVFPVGGVIFNNGATEFARAIEQAHGIKPKE